MSRHAETNMDVHAANFNRAIASVLWFGVVRRAFSWSQEPDADELEGEVSSVFAGIMWLERPAVMLF
jgi:hypothetical protein